MSTGVSAESVSGPGQPGSGVKVSPFGVEAPPGPMESTPESFWRALSQLNYFRLFVAFALAVVGLVMGESSFLSLRNPHWYAGVCATYFLAAWVFIVPMRNQIPSFETQLVRHVIVDIACIGAIMYLSGSGPTGPGLLLIVSMAAVGMLRKRRKLFFWVSLGALVVLSQQVWLVLTGQTGMETLARVGVLAASFFGVATLAHVQANGVLVASRLAREKGVEVENLARVNARMIQELPYAVMALGRHGEVLQYNARVEALLGTRFFPLCNLHQCAPQLAALWSDWRHHRSLPDHPFQSGRDGRRLIPRFIELEPSRQEGAVLVLEDMTELESQAQRMKLASLGMLTANLAHEIRNPLSAIRHAAGILAEEHEDDVSRRLTRIINDNADRLNGLVEDVLALNRRDRMQRQELVLAEVVPRFLLDFAQREKVPDEVIHLHLNGNPHLCMDANHLEQILWNLLRNAWRYCTRQTASIRVRLSSQDDFVNLDVINDGPPISAATKARLFEPFYTTAKQGTGLGLYIARDLAEANGASLSYMDVEDGAMFRLRGRSGTCKEKAP
jgi:two-component system, NtrC family, sensor histidine kinase PilS